MVKYTPTKIGRAGSELKMTAPLQEGACPECPWRKEMTRGFNVAYPSDEGQMMAATTHYGEIAQGCHMRLDHRCRGAHIFRANLGLPSEANPDSQFMESESEAFSIWISRGFR